MVVLLLIAALALRVAFNDTTTPVSRGEVVERFRAELTPVAPTATPVAPTATPVATPMATPPPRVAPAASGVYRHRTAGREAVDVLGGATHDYPAETTLTLRPVGCGTSYRWDALAERTEEWVLCEGSDGLALDRYESMHRFFSQEDRESLTCPERLLLVPAVPDPGATWTGTCAGDRVEELLTVTVVGLSTQTVAGVDVDVVEVKVDVQIGSTDDSIVGESVSRYWFELGSGLVVRWAESTRTVAGSFIGDVTYVEAFDVRLVDREPLT